MTMETQIAAIAAAGFDFEAFVRGYMVAALWSSSVCDEDGNNCQPMDDEYGVEDISPECMAEMRADCADFVASNLPDLLAYVEARRVFCRANGFDPAGGAGHDFWLTRNGHGAGFWDRGLGELGDRLSEASNVYGGVDLYPGNDGLIYA